MPALPSVVPAHRGLWSGLACDDTDAEVGVLGVPFERADITSFATLKVIYEAWSVLQEKRC